DALTGLPNRATFAREAGAALARAREDERGLALVFVDLDRFKPINDTLGHAAGDQLLREVARRLLTSVRTDDLVARLGGDEMIVLLHNPSGDGSIDRHSVRRVAKRILGAFTPSFKLEHHELSMSASLGIAIAPEDAESIDDLIDRADRAMYEAKEEGRNRFCFYSSELDEGSGDRLALDRRLRRALEADALELHYQPIVDVGRGAVVAMEALLRWRQGDGELWRPERFLDVAEATGLVVPLGRWVLRTACADAAAWRRDGHDWGLAVNLSSQQLDHEGLPDAVVAALEASGLPAEHLSLEITEDAVVERTEARLAQTKKLRASGLRLSIDDFGTGLLSLPHLQRLDFDELKIDRAFVSALGGGDGDSSVAHTILALAKGLGVDVVAEGVETEAELAALVELGCRRAQGYLIGRP
ncbi:MAG: EAL domain-containing protein, partial [Acidobacteriota bacterium]